MRRGESEPGARSPGFWRRSLAFLTKKATSAEKDSITS